MFRFSQPGFGCAQSDYKQVICLVTIKMAMSVYSETTMNVLSGIS